MRNLVLLLIWISCLTLNAEDREPKNVKDAFSKEWSVIRVSYYHFMGDFDQEYPVIFFQLLPDNQILLSVAVQRRWDRLIPKPVRFVGVEEWEKLEGEILKHYSTAYNSDPDAQIRKNGFGSDFHSIELSVTGFNTKQFSHRFSHADESAKRFREFLEQLAEPPKDQASRR